MRTLIIANWKCNPISQKEAKDLFDSVKNGLKMIKNVETVICPPFVYLLDLQQTTNNLSLGAQDCFWEKAGAFTGEISPTMLKDLGCRYVILGHSERERYFSETDEMTNKKIRAAISAKLSPILCIGETEKERKKGKTQEVLKQQLTLALKNIPKFSILNSQFCVVYEPVWAIGTGNPCSPSETQKAVVFIRKIISGLYSNTILDNLRILYGGSVNSGNVKDYIIKSGVNGFIIGGASLNPKEFIKIVRMISS